VAEKRQIHNVKIIAQRGSIYDRNNNVLAMSLPIKTLCINPSRIYKNNDKSILEISDILGLSKKKLKEIINKNKNKNR
jgi:cell division protein FtsI/penicillin-binding protein 2